jgi:uncharacterized protein YjbJ (UPF0337 family)
MDHNKAEELKGRAKVAAGELADDDELKREGRFDKGAAKVKRAADDAVDSTKDALTGHKH